MKNLHLALLSLMIVFISYSCSWTAAGHKIIMYKNSNGWFPSDFEPEKVVLLIPKSTDKRERRKMDTLLKKYSFRYEYPNNYNDDSLNINYADSLTYRYIFKSKVFEVKYYDSQTHLSSTSTYADIYIYDRLKKKAYPTTGYYSFGSYDVFIEVVKYIVKKYGIQKK
jgi:hypothetical protein